MSWCRRRRFLEPSEAVLGPSTSESGRRRLVDVRDSDSDDEAFETENESVEGTTFLELVEDADMLEPGKSNDRLCSSADGPGFDQEDDVFGGEASSGKRVAIDSGARNLVSESLKDTLTAPDRDTFCVENRSGRDEVSLAGKKAVPKSISPSP